MTRKYPFFIQIAYIALFWNSVGPIYSTKKVANQKRCVGGVPVELNLFVPFRIQKAHFSEKKFSRPKTNFHSGKRAVSVVLITITNKVRQSKPQGQDRTQILLHSDIITVVGPSFVQDMN